MKLLIIYLFAFFPVFSPIAFSQMPTKNILYVGHKSSLSQFESIFKSDASTFYNIIFQENISSLASTFELLHSESSDSLILVNKKALPKKHFDVVILQEGSYQFLSFTDTETINSFKLYEVYLKIGGKLIFQSCNLPRCTYPIVYCSRYSFLNSNSDSCSDTIKSDQETLEIFKRKETLISKDLKNCEILPIRDFVLYAKKNHPNLKMAYPTGKFTVQGNLIDAVFCYKMITKQAFPNNMAEKIAVDTLTKAEISNSIRIIESYLDSK